MASNGGIERSSMYAWFSGTMSRAMDQSTPAAVAATQPARTIMMLPTIDTSID
jgi:hypothetical protein